MSFGKSSYEYPDQPPADGDPEIMYVNLDIINNNRNDASMPDPPVRFNESRDAPIIKNASAYQFSIVRFTMSGPNLDLPLFIPVVKTGQTNPNLTEYEMAISYSQEWSVTEGNIVVTVTPAVNSVIYAPETLNTNFAPVPLPPVTSQDISTRYYWVYTYQHWVDLVNQALDQAFQNTYAAFQAKWATLTADPSPYASYTAWKAGVGNAPYMEYNAETNLFSIYGDSRCFGTNIGFTPSATELTAPECRLFFDSNMFSLFANFPNTFYGGPTANPAPFPTLPTPVGYISEILFPNKNYQNVLDLTSAPAYVPAADKQVYWITTQELLSTSSLWSPIASLVFTTTLLPIRTEAVGQPVVLGENNLGYSSSSIQNAFQPIVTDISLDLSTLGAKEYRSSIYYAPQAEYRMASLTPSKQPVNSIDIQVFWKSRLTGQLFPVSIPNLGSVSLKCMFRRIRH